jgi:oxygen-dependent protoporphyrinogen oxidase
MTERTFVVIVGGGITGLALANHLRRAGVSHTLLEATDRVGGVIRSGYVEDSLLEWGPQRTRLTVGLRELLEELGISRQLVTAPPGLPLFVYSRKKLRKVPFSVVDFLLSDIVPFRSKLRVLVEPLTGEADPDESVADYFTRKLGRRLYENMAGPLYGGLYASDPADMVVRLSLGHVLAEFGVGRSLIMPLLRRGGSVDPPAACSFMEGMETLPLALHAVNAQNVRVDAPVRAIHLHPQGWEVEGEGGSIVADRVVVTVPAAAAARLLRPVLGRAADTFASLTYNPLAIVHLRAETTLEGLGYQVSLAERLATRGVTFNDSLFGRRDVYTAYLGGAKAPEVVGWGDEAIAATAVREFRTVTGFDAGALYVDREAMPAWDNSWVALDRISMPPGLHLAANWESRPGIPGRLAQAKRLAQELTVAFGRVAGVGARSSPA